MRSKSAGPCQLSVTRSIPSLAAVMVCEVIPKAPTDPLSVERSDSSLGPETSLTARHHWRDQRRQHPLSKRHVPSWWKPWTKALSPWSAGRPAILTALQSFPAGDRQTPGPTEAAARAAGGQGVGVASGRRCNARKSWPGPLGMPLVDSVDSPGLDRRRPILQSAAGVSKGAEELWPLPVLRTGPTAHASRSRGPRCCSHSAHPCSSIAHVQQDQVLS